MLPFILTASGQDFYFLNPSEESIQISDIAASLSKLCRYAGHTSGFYSVAQHSVIVSHLVPPEFAFEGLMHDAAEAYLGDISSPLKHCLTEYQAIELGVEYRIAQKFGLKFDSLSGWPPAVKKADIEILALETRHLMPPIKTPWSILEGVVCPDASYLPTLWTPEQAEFQFLKRFYEVRSLGVAAA